MHHLVTGFGQDVKFIEKISTDSAQPSVMIQRETGMCGFTIHWSVILLFADYDLSSCE